MTATVTGVKVVLGAARYHWEIALFSGIQCGDGVYIVVLAGYQYCGSAHSKGQD